MPVTGGDGCHSCSHGAWDIQPLSRVVPGDHDSVVAEGEGVFDAGGNVHDVPELDRAGYGSCVAPRDDRTVLDGQGVVSSGSDGGDAVLGAGRRGARISALEPVPVYAAVLEGVVPSCLRRR